MFEGQYLNREMVNTGDADESLFTHEVSEVNPSKEQSLIQSEYLQTDDQESGSSEDKCY